MALQQLSCKGLLMGNEGWGKCYTEQKTFFALLKSWKKVYDTCYAIDIHTRIKNASYALTLKFKNPLK